MPGVLDIWFTAIVFLKSAAFVNSVPQCLLHCCKWVLIFGRKNSQFKNLNTTHFFSLRIVY